MLQVFPLYLNVGILMLNNICCGVSFYFASVTIPYHKVFH